MCLMDICAAMSAYKHARQPVVTASVDRLDFLAPAKKGDILILKSDLRSLFGETQPHTLPIGHELSGIVKEVNSSKFEHIIGKKVAVDTVSAGKACDSCKHCLNGLYTYCLDKDLDSGGSYAEYITRRAKGCFILNDDMNFNEGALIEPLAVAVQAFRKLLPVAGDNLIILGSGTIGLMCLYMASQMNFNQIIITGKYKHQKDMAKYLGADHVLDYDCLLYTSPSPRDGLLSRMPSSA